MGVVVLFVLAVPLSAEAQQSHVARIGIIANGSPPSAAASVDPFCQRLRGLGYVEDRNVAIEVGQITLSSSPVLHTAARPGPRTRGSAS
jgi:hypothetical protein